MSSKGKSLGFILMMDASPSIGKVIGNIIIDAKAFTREARVGDQFGINRFSNTADWVYPTGSNPNIVTVTSGLSEITAATDKMDNIYPFGGLTNIGAALQLANTMIDKATTDIKAFVLISDGQHNTGVNPNGVLGNQPPIYVAGLGPWMRKSYFENLIAKNANSKFYHSPDAIDMSLIFNTILADASKATLALNKQDLYKQSAGEYFKHEFNLSDKGSRVNLGIVWSDKRCYYTTESPSGFGINLSLRDPDNNKVNIAPVINGDGSCIYHLDNVKPGKWTILAQHALSSNSVRGTTGVIDLDSTISAKLMTPNTAKKGEQIDLSLSVLSDNLNVIENASVKARVSAPVLSVEEALNRYEHELKNIEVNEDEACTENIELLKLKSLRREKLAANGVDILPVETVSVLLDQYDDGLYKYPIAQTNTTGIYTMEFIINGVNPKTGIDFTRIERHSIFVD